MYRDAQVDNYHRLGVIQARHGAPNEAQQAFGTALERLQERMPTAGRLISDLGAQGADIEADFGNALRLSAVNAASDQDRQAQFDIARRRLNHASQESGYILNVWQSTSDQDNPVVMRDIRELRSIHGKVLSNLGKLALTRGILADRDLRGSGLSSRVESGGNFLNADIYLQAGDNGLYRVENDMWAMLGALSSGSRRHNVEYWHRQLINDLGWTALHDRKNFMRAGRVAARLGWALLRGRTVTENTVMEAF